MSFNQLINQLINKIFNKTIQLVTYNKAKN